MSALASVQTAADTSSLTWGYVLGSLLVALLFLAVILAPAYFDSTFHRRGVARRRAYRNRREAPVVRHR